MSEKFVKKDDISIVIGGAAGQGMDTVSNILQKVFKKSLYNSFVSKEFMSRIRGGCNSSEIRVCSQRVNAHVDRIDLLFPLNKEIFNHLKKRITKDTIVFVDKSNVDVDFNDKCKVIEVDFIEIAKEIGSTLYSNTVSIGLLMGLLGLEFGPLEEYLKEHFGKKSEDIVNKNIDAAKRGFDLANQLKEEHNIEISIEKDESIADDIVLSGTDAVSIGCIAGGCDFLASYPMSPATGVLVYLAHQAEEFGILVEQAEDEIAALNMSLGAWYAGARALVTTSGGGFALMTEAVSLAGIIESPAVIHIAQRPGPATGLPTRTEQADLELALYAGHGEYHRAIYAPRTIEDAFFVSQHAFNVADKFQVPTFILSDQYLCDSSYNTPAFDLEKTKVENYVVETQEDYKRYALTDDGISPRGIPGHGKGLVLVDSDEHTEEGRITEDEDIRQTMMDKRLKRLKPLTEEALKPELIGTENYKTLIIGWGSTYNTIKEAMAIANRDDVAFLSYKQVYPLHPDTADYLKKAEKTVMIEGNATSQFSKLIKLNTGIDIDQKVLKYNGSPFTVEEVTETIKSL